MCLQFNDELTKRIRNNNNNAILPTTNSFPGLVCRLLGFSCPRATNNNSLPRLQTNHALAGVGY